MRKTDLRGHGMAMRLFVVALLTAPVFATAAEAAPASASQIAPARMGSINNDAMTMQRCRERLALPKNARPKDDDPRVDLDAVCTNMLGSSAKSRAPQAASTASR
jgi:hypothetical protein